MKVPTLLVLSVVFFLTQIDVASAHGAGITFTATSTTDVGKPYVVDIDYADLAIVADSLGRFDFNLFEDAERTKPVPFTDIWVRIEEKSEGKRGMTLYAGSVAKMLFGGTGFSFVFPKAGTYKLSVRYNDAKEDDYGTTVAEAEFSLDVRRPYNEPIFRFSSIEFWGGLGVGFLAFGAGLLAFLFWFGKLKMAAVARFRSKMPF